MDLATFRRALQHRLARDVRGAPRLDRRLLDEVTLAMSREDLLPDGPLDGLFADLQREAILYGPLWRLVFDGTVSEIMVNGPHRVFTEREGRKVQEDLAFESEDAFRHTLDNILKLDPTIRLDHSKPWADISLPDGSRANLVIPPIARTPHLTIRKYQGSFKAMEDFVANGTLDARIAAFLQAATRARFNVLFSGATGTGKTTLLEVLARSIDPSERLVCIEDALELHLDHPNVARLLTRLANLEGKGEVTIGDLFRNALRMAPDRVLLGEIRGREAYDYLQALTSGHDGSLAILHASSPEEAVVRLQNLVPLAGLGVPPMVVKRQIALGLDFVVQLHQLADGSRKVTRVTEVRGLDASGELELVDLFAWENGRFVGSGTLPVGVAELERSQGLRRDVFAGG